MTPDAAPAPTRATMYCRQCSYALDGLDQPRCPECGRPFNPTRRRTYRRRPRAPWPLRWAKRGAVFVPILLFAYVGAYLSLVQAGPIPGVLTYTGRHARTADYRLGGRWAKAIFAPLNHLDRCSRRRHWSYFEGLPDEVIPAAFLAGEILRSPPPSPRVRASARTLLNALQELGLLEPGTPNWQLKIDQIKQLEVQLRQARQTPGRSNP